MSTRTDPPKLLGGLQAPTSPGAGPSRPLAVAPQPVTASELAERYGVPSLELFVVDPANLFVSWEINVGQLDEASEALGSGFAQRKLKVAVQLAAEPGDVLVQTELFGDVGRWFLAVPPVGSQVIARLYFEADGKQFELRSAGPVDLPRVAPVEPGSFEELHVSYGFGPGGRLSLAGATRARSDELPGFGLAREADPAGAASPAGGLPSSPARWSGSWPPSPSSMPGGPDD